MANQHKLGMLLAGAIAAGLIWQAASSSAYGANLVLTGDTENLLITPENEDLFRIGSMLPGESAAAGIQIRNTDRYAFTLSVEVKNLTPPEEDGADLLDVLNIKVVRGNTEIADFPAKGGQYTLGRYTPGAEDMLLIDIELSPTEATNAYQNKSAELQWIFTATSENPGDTGGGGGGSPGGGGGGGVISYTPVTVAEEPVPLSIPEETTESLEVPEEEIPLGTITPEEEELIQVTEGDVPLGTAEMPKTGELSRLYNILAGFASCGFGLIMLLRVRQDK